MTARDNGEIQWSGGRSMQSTAQDREPPKTERPPSTKRRPRQNATQDRTPPGTERHPRQNATQDRMPPGTERHPRQNAAWDRTPPKTECRPRQNAAWDRAPPKTECRPRQNAAWDRAPPGTVRPLNPTTPVEDVTTLSPWSGAFRRIHVHRDVGRMRRRPREFVSRRLRPLFCRQIPQNENVDV